MESEPVILDLFLDFAVFSGPGVHVTQTPCFSKLAASSMEARSGNELDRRNDVVFVRGGLTTKSICIAFLRKPNCF